jgi:hypothetical protein
MYFISVAYLFVIFSLGVARISDLFQCLDPSLTISCLLVIPAAPIH